MATYDSSDDTREHGNLVNKYLSQICNQLKLRGIHHDDSKLGSIEKPIFDEFTPKLKWSTYGSEEYRQFLEEMRPALEHHYQENRHHPEHFLEGMFGMNLIDLVEMFCDWMAASKRHYDGDIFKSIEINQRRFQYPDMLKQIFINTARKL